MKIAYIAHPVGGDVENNLKDLRRIIAKINEDMRDVVPFCPYYADVVSLNDNDPTERAWGIMNAHTLLASGVVDELWLTGERISDGMDAERVLAIKKNIPVINMIGKL